MIVTLQLTFAPNFYAAATKFLHALHPDQTHRPIQVGLQDLERAG